MAKVLFADDDILYRTAFQDGLSAVGHDVDVVEQGDLVIPTLADKDYDIVFLDVLMAGGGGITILHELRQVYADLPVVIITGMSELAGSPLFRDGLRKANAKVMKTASLDELDRLIGSLTG